MTLLPQFHQGLVVSLNTINKKSYNVYSRVFKIVINLHTAMLCVATASIIILLVLFPAPPSYDSSPEGVINKQKGPFTMAQKRQRQLYDVSFPDNCSGTGNALELQSMTLQLLFHSTLSSRHLARCKVQRGNVRACATPNANARSCIQFEEAFRHVHFKYTNAFMLTTRDMGAFSF